MLSIKEQLFRKPIMMEDEVFEVTKDQASVFINIPFCIKRRKGDEVTMDTASRETRNAYLTALEKEVFAAGDLLEGKEVTSLYIGGGFASMLSPDRIARMLLNFKRTYQHSKGMELTIHFAPETIGSPSLSGLNVCNFNRVSVEALSVNDGLLQQLGTSYRFDDIDDAYTLLNTFEYNNISSDIMYGLPGLQKNSLRNAIIYATSTHHQTHVNLLPYELAKQEGISIGELEEQYLFAKALLENRGFREYGAGKFARPGREWRFALNECHGVDRIGFGLGARSHVSNLVFQNTTDLNSYIKNSPTFTSLIALSAEFDQTAMRKRYLLSRLQLAEGIDPHLFEGEFECKLYDVLGEKMRALTKEGLVSEHNSYVLTSKGIICFNRVQDMILSK
jgi:coproporphyrinogen III oxidase-like Fe-S oxidoreductase